MHLRARNLRRVLLALFLLLCASCDARLSGGEEDPPLQDGRILLEPDLLVVSPDLRSPDHLHQPVLDGGQPHAPDTWAVDASARDLAEDGVNCPAPSRTIQVTGSQQLEQALAGALCGDRILLHGGTYQGAFKITSVCTASDPVVIQAGQSLSPIISSKLSLEGRHTTLIGLSFKGGSLTVKGDNHRILGCRFSGWKHPAAILVLQGSGVEIGYCELSKPHPWLAQEPTSYPLRIGIRSGYKTSFHTEGWVHHNHFFDFPAKPDPANYHSGQSDAIEVCFTGYSKQAQWVIEYNLIDNHLQGHGIVDMKCGGNIARFNTVLNSPGGRIDLRNGSYSTVAGNWIENSGGISTHGGFHTIVGNHLTGTGVGISIIAGKVSWNDWSTSSTAQQTYKAHLAGNVSDKLTIGRKYTDEFIFPVVDTRVEAHQGPIVKQFEQGTVIKPQASIPLVQAKKLSPAEVGPPALPAYCP